MPKVKGPMLTEKIFTWDLAALYLSYNWYCSLRRSLSQHPQKPPAQSYPWGCLPRVCSPFILVSSSKPFERPHPSAILRFLHFIPTVWSRCFVLHDVALCLCLMTALLKLSINHSICFPAYLTQSIWRFLAKFCLATLIYRIVCVCSIQNEPDKLEKALGMPQTN